MERREDSVADEQDVQNERNDRTREAKTVESPRNEVESRKKRHRENWKKRKKGRRGISECERKTKWKAELSRRKRTDRGNAKMQKQ